MSIIAAPTHLLPVSPTSLFPTTSSRNRNPFSTTTVSPLPSPIVRLPISANRPFKNSKPLKSPPARLNRVFSPKSFTLSVGSGTLFNLATSLVDSGGGVSRGGGRGGSGHGGRGRGGGKGGGNFWSRILSFFLPGIFALKAVAKDNDPQQEQEWNSHGLPANIVVQLNKLSGFKKYKISDIIFFDQRSGSTIGSDDSFFQTVMSLHPGGIYNKVQLRAELETLASCGMFEKVDLETKTNPDGTINITVPFVENMWPAMNGFRCINVGLMPQSKPIEVDPDMTEKEMIEFYRNQERDYRRRIEKARPCLLPAHVKREIFQMLEDQGKVSARFLHKISGRMQKWYHENGYTLATVVGYRFLNNKEVVFEVIEGDITKLVFQFQDKLGNVCEGNTQFPVIMRELPKQLRKGQVYNYEAGRQAMRNISSLSLFSNAEAKPIPDDKNYGGFILPFKFKEAERKYAEVSTDWSIVPGHGGRPTLESIQPGGTVSFEHRNINGLNRSLLGSVTASNFLNPQDDLAFKLEYVHPYVDGVYNPRNRTFRTSCFNSRKLSPVFTGGPEIEGVPPIWVDRAGVKANITEEFTRQSKFTYGLVMEEITTRDGDARISANGQRVLPTGEFAPDGPPTTLSGTGVDRMSFLQANITRDNTKFLNGAIVGDRNVFQLDQGLGIGNNFPFFNRHQFTLTRFLQLKQVEEGAGKPPPPVLVLHGHYGGCVGDLSSYDAFTLGGPYSVRGYEPGELGAARNILEVAAELRIPVRNTQVYMFAEHGNDLGSSKDVKGNPTEVYRRMGHGSSYGVGMKLGQVRAEYAVDHNSGTGAMFFRYGERF